jgi:Mn2+/Fe2+ NRAMP family transporter
VKKTFQIALGIITSIGGFLDVGAIATAAQAGAGWGFQLLWAILLGTIAVIFLVEMSGRLAAVSRHPLRGAIRARFGINYALIPFLAGTAINFPVMAAEVGGCCIALQLVTGIAYPWFALPVALAVWLVLWNGTFEKIENVTSLLGLVTLCFVVAAVWLRPDPAALLRGLVVPTLPGHDRVEYWFVAVSIVGAILSPYLFDFYSSGAVEDEWDESYLTANRIIAAGGMGFGSIVAIGVLICAAVVLHPRGIRVDRYEQVALILAHPWGKAGFFLFAASLFIACFGAAMETALDVSYMAAQTLGWNWGENPKPIEAARFSMAYTVFIFPASALILVGLDPLKLTLFSMALSAVTLPVVVLPFLVLMNDPRYLGEHRNGWASNVAVFVVMLLAFVVAVVAIPLEIFGGQ